MILAYHNAVEEVILAAAGGGFGSAVLLVARARLGRLARRLRFPRGSRPA